MYTSKMKTKASSVNVWRSLCWWPVPYHRAGHRKSPPTVTAETMARHDEKTSVGRAKVLSPGQGQGHRTKKCLFILFARCLLL